MSITTFRAKTMRDALAQVRAALGPDAEVLHTREAPAGALTRLWGGGGVEVAARPAERRAINAPPAVDPHSTRIQGEFRNRVSERLEALRADIESLAPRYAEPEGHAETLARLLRRDVDEAVARELVEELRRDLPPSALREPLLVEERLVAGIGDRLAVAGPIVVKPGATRVVALVGPTGVGKTTTLAKLAANFRLHEHRTVALVTVDTFRVAAVEQLRTYAEIIDLPMEVVATPGEMRDAVDRLRGHDLVLIDTAGRSPRDGASLQELRAVLRAAGVDETHLVVSATASRSALRETLRLFTAVAPTALVLSKLDEAPTLGGLVGLGDQRPLPISYLTDGQKVPDDILVADAQELARRVLGARCG